MRQVVLDTETTGLSWEKGNRIVEIGCIELLERRKTGRHFHRYFNPERDLEAGAQEVTGLSLEFLRDKPLFASAVDEFLDFIRGAELIIHNASFDIGFLDYELSRLGPHYGRIEDHATVLDTLAMARERYPGQRNSLDALCRRLGVDNTHRKLHGALLDAELLAEVYLGMTAGQADLMLVAGGDAGLVAHAGTGRLPAVVPAGPRRVLRASEAERAAHEARLEKIAGKSGGKLVWPRAESVPS
ncbi:DNA polymerase III subunit epsilon [Arenimonas fontis]|uniref:DNA polymerase III subunit epsilon n=1 Tax=Arenimonas fontis TaxID=2608255 RepID=A0A5B2ZDF5_9GAMM|nr:DNA polymerase III subunit epsilon [Arenimonas fontis]KAA2285653.1 DNA polymerase III subunit epsilon [Arenimonas fontis]